jgi:hypothetical protein
VSQSGAELIVTDRQRQIDVEGYDEEHDDAHKDGAILYAAQGFLEAVQHPHRTRTPQSWPEEWVWKPPSKYPDNLGLLVKAGALIAAEIDRRLRAGEQP